MKSCSPSAESALTPMDIGEESCNIACSAPCLILAGTSLKVIERLQHLGGKRDIPCLPVRSTQTGFISRSMD